MIDFETDTSQGYMKWLTVGQLREILATIPDDYTITQGRVGNPCIGRPGEHPTKGYCGYIDMSEGFLELWEGAHDPSHFPDRPADEEGSA